MNELIKPIIQEILQARVDGLIREVPDMLSILEKHEPAGGYSYDQLSLLTDLSYEVLPCDNIPAAKAFAEKYGLTVVV